MMQLKKLEKNKNMNKQPNINTAERIKIRAEIKELETKNTINQPKS